MFLYARDYPYIYLWDSDTDAPIGLVACDWLSQFRVAVTAAFAIKTLANPDVKKITFFGAGKFATEACRLLAQEWKDAEVQVLASTLSSARAFASTITGAGKVVANDDPQDAIQNADVVVTLTNAKEPFVQSGWLGPGALLLSMGSAHEVDIDVLNEVDAWIIDDLPYAQIQGDLGAWLRRGELSKPELPGRIRANIGEVVAGLKAGRRHPDERIFTILQGLTACDVALAKAVLDRASEENIGQSLTL